MTPAIPLEDRLLARARGSLAEVLGEEASVESLRLEVLEACAAKLAGFSLQGYRDLFGEKELMPVTEAMMASDAVLPALDGLPIHPSLALTSLARPQMSVHKRRSVGQYYTDWRLAQHLVKGTLRGYLPGQHVIDPASGTGILLVAMAIAIRDEQQRARFITSDACAADLSPAALRGVRLALASTTPDLAAVESLGPRLRRIDSLVAGKSAWVDIAPDGFDAVIGNPPWEKLKVTRHEHLTSRGIERHYGSGYTGMDLSGIDGDRARMFEYLESMGQAYALQGGGEPDLYKLFLALALDLLSPNGQLAMLVPAGFIRSEGTEALRRHLLKRAGRLSIEISDNRARYFAIDSRFKFLSIRAALGDDHHPRQTISLAHIVAKQQTIASSQAVSLTPSRLKRLRPDLTIPEVRSQAEWNLFGKMCGAGALQRSGAGEKRWSIVRELDMTQDRGIFRRRGATEALPLIEGRMVHQFRHAAKSFVSGSGRSAVWSLEETGSRECVPQFWVKSDDLPSGIARRTEVERIGFCDITGQTNERTMLASRIPAGVVCNNKVPTIAFDGAAKLPPRGWVWLAIANSFAFDWMLRRVVTTTVNYFILRSLPFPRLGGSPEERRIVQLARSVERGYHGECDADSLRLGTWRAELDALVMRAYGLGLTEAELIFRDFPLLDRGQPSLRGERHSTITRDLVLAALADLQGESVSEWRERADRALLVDAFAYVPAQLARQRASMAAIS